jgi:hypothetical protein
MLRNTKHTSAHVCGLGWELLCLPEWVSCFRVSSCIRVCREPTLTTRTQGFSGCLDYVWLSKQHWQVQSTLEMPFQEPHGEPGPPDGVSTEMLGPCPSKDQPSDHLAVGCDALLLPVGAAAAVGSAPAAAAAGAAAGRN